MLIRRVARPLLSAVFIGQGVETLRNPQSAADAARPVMEGLQVLPAPVGAKVPRDAETFARLNAAVQVGAGLLLAIGKLPRVSAAALAITVIPGNLGADMFWKEADPERRVQKRRDLLTDVSLLGGLIIASADTAGKPSLGWRGRRAASRLTEAVSAAVPGAGSSNITLGDFDLGEKLGHGLQAGADRGRELVSAASEKSAPLVEAALKRGHELVGTARERGTEIAEVARERGAELAATVRERGAEFADTAQHQADNLADITNPRLRVFHRR